ncbi:MAG: xanthine dehydrogenase family protein subunit M [SAR202 cluster bacterium]|nr:xanthine dehydrogenase family protein subunit M [SAR202 cluster bacterium]
MHPFEYIQPRSLKDASRLLADDPAHTRPIAGGTDLLSELKDGLLRPHRLISLASLKPLQTISYTSGAFRLGAAVTLTQIAHNPALAQAYPLIAQAASVTATPQIRNTATLGGNLCQRPRCWYYRHPLFRCLKKGGKVCYAVNGYNKNLAILGGAGCYIVHPSDLAPALIAAGASIEIHGTAGLRALSLEDFFVGPRQRMTQENVLSPGDLVAYVNLPSPMPNSRSVYLKARERQGEDFAMASVAALASLDRDTVRHARIVLGGVAPTPHRARRAEEILAGRRVSDIDPQHVGELAVAGARPMRDNAYKVTLAGNLVRSALDNLLGR